MKIENLKINGIPEPLGYRFDKLSLSWLVTEAKGKKTTAASVDVAEDDSFSSLCFHTEGAELSCADTALRLELKPRTRYHVRAALCDETGDGAEAFTWFETGKRDEPWQASWISTPKGAAFHPVFSRHFLCEKEVRKARLYICGLGLFKAKLNGKKLGDEQLTPYFTDYSREAQVITFDVTELLQAENRLEILLGKGWYLGRFGMDGQVSADRFALIAELRIDYCDGSSDVIGTDESWRYTASDVADSGIYDGETLDRLLWAEKPRPEGQAEILPAPVQLTDRSSLPVRVTETRKPVALLHTPAGETVLDLGQNFAGWLRFEADFPAGTEVRLRFGEVLQDGNFYNGNYRSAVGGFRYVSDGRRETVEPRFTYFGFRYVLLEGWPEAPKLEDFTGCVVHSDLERTGFFACEVPEVNRLYENTLWGLRSNFVDIPTDCPQRDERMAWTGDAQIFAPTASYHADTRAFFAKFLRMLRVEQEKQNGGVPAYVPAGRAFCPICSLWGDAATFLPDTLWRFYGDDQQLKLWLPMMRDWVDYVGERIKEENGDAVGLWRHAFQFGDWLALDGRTELDFKGATPDAYVAGLCYYQSLKILTAALERLNLEESGKYAALRDRQRAFLLDEYFTPHGHLCVNTQSAFLLAMRFELYRDAETLTEDFVALLKRDGFRIRAGFAGAPVLCQMLSRYGRHELAIQFLLNEDYPGWLNEVKLGATTVWERWNSIGADGRISPVGMNSLNHYSYGSVAEFLYADVLGIRPSEQGFRQAILSPKPDARLRRVEGSYRSVWGEYRMAWEILPDGQVSIRFTVPFGCTALVSLPESGKEPFAVSAGDYAFTYLPQQDFRKLFTPDCLLAQVFCHDTAKALLLSLLPEAAALDNPGGHEKQISDLFELAAQGCDPGKIGAAVGALSQINAFEEDRA